MKVALIAAILFFVLAVFFAAKYFLTGMPKTQSINGRVIDESIDAAVQDEVERVVQNISDEEILSSLLE
ncbi:MAG: hypothetical protein QXM68_01615 [Candidatus Aenigmatarchaeota archaeon]|nr:hypothetical protein [Candidatus Aenigmarchaeota archaeon]